MIKGFTKYEENYYLVAEKEFSYCYSLYGFCSACKILRCSPIWCICGRKELSALWTSNNKKLDRVIRNSQKKTEKANEAYLEWIPSEWLLFDSSSSKITTDDAKDGNNVISPTNESNNQWYANTWVPSIPVRGYHSVDLIPVEISEKTENLFYYQVSGYYTYLS